jgi:hypothetical protein
MMSQVKRCTRKMRRQRGVQQLKDNVKSFGGLGEEKLDVLLRNELKLQKNWRSTTVLGTML